MTDKVRNRRSPGGAIWLMNDEFIIFLHLTIFFEGVENSFQGMIPTISKTFKFSIPELIKKPLEFREIYKMWREKKEKKHFFFSGQFIFSWHDHKIASFHLLLISYKGKNNMPRYLLLKSCYKKTLRWKGIWWVTVIGFPWLKVGPHATWTKHIKGFIRPAGTVLSVGLQWCSEVNMLSFD